MSDFLEDWYHGLKKPRPVSWKHLSATTIDNDRWDRQDLENVLASMPDFKKQRNLLCDSVLTGAGATSDTWMSFFKDKPLPLSTEQIRPDYVVNAFVRDELAKLTEWEELRGLGTVGDDLSSAMAFMSMRESLEALFDKVQAEQDLAKQMGEKMQELEDSDGKSVDDLMDEMAEREKLEQEIQDLADQIKEGLESKESEVRQQLREGLNEASDEAKEMQTAMETWGTGQGTVQRKDGKKRLEIAKRIKDKPKLKRIADLVGPMKSMAFGEQRKKVNTAPEEIYDIEAGDDIQRLLPSELIGLIEPLTEAQMFQRLAEASALQYALKGSDKVGLGEIICAIDCSGSMSGDREIWAKAVGISLLHLAHAQKRGYRGILFASSNQIKEWDFTQPEEVTPDGVMDFAEHFFSGGTSFQEPLTLAVKRLREQFDATGEIKGDIVFITDGFCRVSEEWYTSFKQEQERLGFQVFGVVVGASYDTSEIDRICDGRVVSVEKLTSGDDVRSVFRDVHTPS